MQQEPNISVVTNRPDYFRSFGWEKFINLQDALYPLDYTDMVQWDLETSGLGSFRETTVNSAQIGIPGYQFVFDIPSISGGLQCLKSVLERKLVVGHNLKFDIPHANHAGIVIRNVFDTMVAEEYLLLGLEVRHDLDRFKNLADTLRRNTGIIIDKSLQETIAAGLNSVEDVIYAATDVMHLFDLKDAQMATAARRQLERRIAFENKFLPAMCYLEFCGIHVDWDRFYKWIRKIEAEEFLAEQYLEDTYSKINWASPDQVSQFLLTFGVKEYTEKGNLSVKEDVIKKYAIPVVQDYLKYKKANKKVTTYGRSWLHYVQDNGRIHTRFRQTTDAGRMSCGDTEKVKGMPWEPGYTVIKKFPNIQNIPRNDEHRGLFCAEKGNVFVSADFSSQESVVMAELSGEPTMMEFFLTGDGDMHSLVTRYVNPELAHLSSEEIATNHKDVRSKNKENTYALAYGGDEHTVADQANIPLAEAKKFVDAYFGLFSGLKPYYDQCYKQAVRLGYMPIDALTGGKRYIDNMDKYQEKYNDKKYWNRYWDEKKKDTKWYREEVEKNRWYRGMTSDLRKLAINTKIQGTSAVITKLAMIYLFNWICDNGYFGKIKVVNVVHDSIILEGKEKLKDLMAEKLTFFMELAASKCLSKLKIRAESHITDRWSK